MSLDESQFEFMGCQRCNTCCRWPGQVCLRTEEIQQIARYLGSDDWSFIQQYTRLDNNRQGLALVDKENGECIFLGPEGCLIQWVKPQQCRDFPSSWHNPGLENLCAGIRRKKDNIRAKEHVESIASLSTGITGPQRLPGSTKPWKTYTRTQ